MSSLGPILAAHPLCEKIPYNRIRFAKIGPHGTPLYTVGDDKTARGAAEALRSAVKQFGGNCFHCGKRMKPQDLSQECTRDHLRPKSDGGRDYLHNLVLSCGVCNKKKGGHDLISYRPHRGTEYLKALDEHLVRCLGQLAKG